MSKKEIITGKRVQVSFTEQQWVLLSKFKGEFGDTDADVVRSIVIAWLSEKSFITDTVKQKIHDERLQ
ncbi:MAG: CopG family transcriptional regulator [Candidatus Kapabacteria bacterium]|jgi:hypothetical protein|nr:CopG family transcriptional regulator [Candidatus Kapabacteria bacterium]